MTKKFDFNWRIPVPEPLLTGCLFDKWTEVSCLFFGLFSLGARETMAEFRETIQELLLDSEKLAQNAAGELSAGFSRRCQSFDGRIDFQLRESTRAAYGSCYQAKGSTATFSERRQRADKSELFGLLSSPGC